MMRLNRSTWLSLICASLLTTWLAYTSCGMPKQNFWNVKSTELGNPMTTVAPKLLADLCAVISRCNGQASTGACVTAAMNTGGFDYQLGLPAGDYDTFSAIIQAEQSGSISSNPAATNICSAAINNLSCSDPAVQAAYDSSKANPFVALPSMIPTAPGSCPAVFSTPAGRTDYYVATTGSDASGDGSEAKPWASVTHAAKSLTPGPAGATVHVAPGTYITDVVTDVSGTATARIVFISDQQHGAKIVSDLSGDATVWSNTGNYVDIVGFEIVGAGNVQYGIVNRGSYNRFIGNHVHNILKQGCTATAAGIMHSSTPTSFNDTIGNIVNDVGPDLPSALPRDSYCGSATGIIYYGPHGNIQNNIVYDVMDGIAGWAEATNLNISNNLLFDIGKTGSDGPAGTGIIVGSNIAGAVHDNTTVANNILRNFGAGFGIIEGGVTGQNNKYLNNLVFGVSVAFSLQNGNVDVGTISSDPQMVNFQLDGSGDYRLTSGSPARDAGTMSCAAAGAGVGGAASCTPSTDYLGVARPIGPAIDIGPYEYRP